jgi:hypothetical protein
MDNTYTEVHGGMYCKTHNGFALEGFGDGDECDRYDVESFLSSDQGVAECDLYDLFIQDTV